MPQLSIRALPSEVRIDGLLFDISRLLSGINFGLQKFLIGNASIQALAGEDASFDLGYIQPDRLRSTGNTTAWAWRSCSIVTALAMPVAHFEPPLVFFQFWPSCNP